MIDRERLPGRRPAISHMARYAANPGDVKTEVHFAIGYYLPPSVVRPAEIFLDHVVHGDKRFKDDSDTVAALNDACILASYMLQLGVVPDEIAKRLGDRTAIGAIMRHVATVYAEDIETHNDLYAHFDAIEKRPV